MTTGTDAIRELLETKLQSEFPALQPSVPVHFLNTKFATPITPWIHVAVIPNLTKRANIGAQREFTSLGIVNVTCMVPENDGTKNVREIADSVMQVMIDRQIAIPGGGHVTTYEVQYRDRGLVSNWYTVNVIICYRARIQLVR